MNFYCTKAKFCRFSGLVLLLLSAVLAPRTTLAFGIGLSPTTIEMSIKPAQTHRQVIRVVNVNPKRSLTMTVGTADWSLDENGKLTLSPPGVNEDSAARWLRFSPASFTLKPGEGKQILVDIAVPAKVKHAGDHKAALLVSTLLPPKDKRKARSGIWNKHQVASLFYFTLAPAKSLPVVKAVTVRGNPAHEPVIRMTIANAGNAHARIRGKLILKNAAGETALTQNVNGVVLANQTRLLDTTINARKLSAGKYQLTLDLRNTYAPQTVDGDEPLPVNASLPQLQIP